MSSAVMVWVINPLEERQSERIESAPVVLPPILHHFHGEYMSRFESVMETARSALAVFVMMSWN